MNLNRRQFTAAAAALVAGPAAVRAQGRPVRLVVGFPPGGGLDIITRVIAQGMGDFLGQPFVVDNKPGGDGIISADFVAKSPNDGSVLYVGSGNSMIGTPILKGSAVPYDPFKDFTAISRMGLFTLTWITAPTLPINNLQEFIAHVRARPGQLNYASSNTTTRLAALQLLNQHKLEMAHIPYKGDLAAATDLMASRVHMMCTTIAQARSYIKDNRVKALMLQRDSRAPSLPEVPTVNEVGAVIKISPWSGIFGPGGMQPAVVDRMNQALRAAVSGKEVRERFDQMGFEPAVTSPQEMAALLRNEYEVFRKAVQEDGIKFD